MRMRILSTAAAALLLAGTAYAQQPPQTPPPPAPRTGDLSAVREQGRLDLGFRATDISGDEARFNRFRDLRNGPFLSGLRAERESGNWAFLGEAHNVGYRDQRFFAAFENIGRLKGRFEWDQIPLFISDTTRSLQRDMGNGVLDVPDATQTAIQNKQTTLADAMSGVQPYELRSRRHTAAFDMTYMASRDLDLTLEVRNVDRKGYHLQAFGLLTSPGGFTQDLGIPMENRTTDIKLGAEWANTRGLATASISGSWFDNQIPVVQFDSPLRISDIAAGPSRGLVPTWPSNTLFTVAAGGAYKLPRRTRLTANVSFGRATQNEPLVASTINSALVAPPLLRTTAEAAGNVVSMVYGLNSRPVENVWLNARYRYYDYANKTEHFEVRQLVGDYNLGTNTWENEPLSVRRHTLDLDASFTPMKFLALGAGYTREAAKRSFRIFENTAEDVFRVTADSTGNQYFSVRLKYERSLRDGSDFDAHLLEEVDEQPDMRHFDVANRTRSRTTAILTLTPVDWLSLSGSVADGRDDYDDTGFGLRDNRNRMYGIGADLMPSDTVTFGVFYGREKYTALQYSRTSNPLPNPTFNDPTRDWWIDSSDRVNTVTANLDLIKAIPKVDLRFGYDLSDGDAAYVYGQPANQTVFTTTPLAQLPTLSNRLRGARADLQYYLRPDVAVGVVYRYEDYDVRDFALDEGPMSTLVTTTSTIYTGYMYRPYTAHTGWVRMTYLW